MPDVMEYTTEPRKSERENASGSMSRLYRAVEVAYEGMSTFRERRTEIIKQIVGDSYSKNGTLEPVHLNKIRFALYVYARYLAPKNPQGIVTTRSTALKSGAADLEVALNDVCERMNLGQVLEDAVMDALVGMAVVKIGRTSSENYRINGFEGGSYPYACTVDLDDLVFDFYAKRWEEIEFIGNFYRLPLEDLKDNDDYDQSVVKRLTRSDRESHNKSGEEKASEVSRGGSEPDEFYDYVELCDLYLPRQKRMITVSREFDKNLPPLRDEPYVGHPDGPYQILYYNKVPGQLLPLPPALQWADLHKLMNELFLKLGDQALRQKQVGVTNARAVEDGKQVLEARDGEFVVSDNPGSTVQLSFGGVDNNTLAFTTYCDSLFNKLHGNIEVLAGLGPQSPTLGQDELISAAANKLVVDMQERTFRFTERVMRSIAWTILTDPAIRLPLRKQVDGTDIEVPFEYTPERQMGDIMDYNIQIHPYSMKFTSPAARLAAMNSFMQGVAIPLAGLMQEQGVVFDWQKFVDLWSQYQQMPEIKDIVKYAPQDQQEAERDVMRKPPVTNRNYTRRNVKASSPEAERQELMQALLSRRGGQGG